MKILVTGAKGMLGFDLVPALENIADVTAVDIDDFDITDAKQCQAALQDLQPQWVVHAAAYTQVDKCESERELAMQVNGVGAGNMALACSQVNAKMIYFSTDYVFDGTNREPYPEDADANPLSIYGQSKLMGEKRVTENLQHHALILRTSWLYGIHGKNFVETMIRLGKSNKTLRVVNDQTGSPTFTQDLAQATKKLLELNAGGIIHVCNQGTTTWYGFAKYILEKMCPETNLVPVSTEEYPLPAKRPAYSVMQTEKYRMITGDLLPDWQNAVDRYLNMKNHPMK